MAALSVLVTAAAMLLGLGAAPAAAAQTFEIGGNWALRSGASANSWQSIAYGAGKFVAVGLGTTRVLNSSDGITWSTASAPASLQWSSVTYGNGKFVAVASNASGSKQTMTSSDGSSWSLGGDLGATQAWKGVAYGGDKFVAVGGAPGAVMYSSDGVSWTAATSPVDSTWSSVVYSGSKWVAVASAVTSPTPNGSRAMTSTDGVNWTVQTTPAAGWTSVVYGASKFVAVGSVGKTMYSTDGETWTQSTTGVPVNDWKGVAVGQTAPVGNGAPATRFVAVAKTGTGNRAMYSGDGINWTAGTSSADNQWNSVAYVPGKFVAVSSDGVTRVMTSNNVFLTSNGSTLTIVPASGVTTTGYAINYNTQARVTAGSVWGVWGTKWPANTLSMSLATYQNGTASPCGVAPTVCTRAGGIGQQTIGTTYLYRVTANVGGSGYISPVLSVTRTA